MNRLPSTRPADLFGPPPAAPSWRAWHVALGQEMFGRPAGPWGALFAPVPLVGLGLLALRLLPLPGGWSWLMTRLGELGWLMLAPFVLATVVQGVAMGVSEARFRASGGQEHRDCSPRAWHYYGAIALTALPVVLLQLGGPFLDFYLQLSMKWHLLFGSLRAAHVGYSPHPANLIVLAALPAVFWQVKRLLLLLPCGRLTGMQRELARFRTAVSWDAEAWSQLVGDTFDRWLDDVAPKNLEDPPATEAQRLFRRRWAALRKDVVASFVASPPDLPRANRALMQYREATRRAKAVRF